MKHLWIIILIALTLSSCNFDDFEFYALEGESRGAVCRHEVVMAALVYSEQYSVRIAYGINNESGYHSQAQAYIGENWEWLIVISSHPIQIVVDEKDGWFTVEQYYDLEEFIDEYWFSRGFGKSLE